MPAAGSGSRLGGGEPKAFAHIHGRSLLARSLETIISSGVATTVVVAAPEDFLLRAREEIDSVTERMNTSIPITAVAGGKDRTASVQIALKHVSNAEVVLVHDAARCLTPPDVFRRVHAAVLSGAEAVVPVLPMIDSVRRAVVHPATGSSTTAGDDTGVDRTSDGIVRSIRRDSVAETTVDRPNNSDPAAVVGTAGSYAVVRGDLDRAHLRRVQTPQGFRAETLLRAYDHHVTDDVVTAEGDVSGEDLDAVRAAVPTDDAGLVERLGVEVVAVAGDEEALKITYPLDRILGEHLARLRDADTDSGRSGGSGSSESSGTSRNGETSGSGTEGDPR
nr:2-C-methyl-D-erythritol 4-phosphate cytidylyltransferase [Brevibacterium oceani]